MKKKLKIGVLFGGKSAEHEISLLSARNVINALDKKKYEVIPIGISKEGKWILGSVSNYLLNSDNPKLIKLYDSKKEVALTIQSSGSLTDVKSKKKHGNVDVVFPVLHGPYGEDGSIQGLFKLAGIPFVGAGVLGSAVGMDKDVMKRLLTEAGIKNAKCIALKNGEKLTFEKAKKTLGLPMFVKPANLGSSVGINKIKSKKDWKKFLAEAFLYDSKILIEEAIVGRELECAVLGNDEHIASGIGEVVLNAEFYSYDAKYIDEDGAIIEIPAKNLSKNILQKLRETAVKAYKALECAGMGRVDMFLTKRREVYVNEINTIPGFTNISMYPKLWAQAGIPQTKLLDILINLAIDRFEKEKKLRKEK